MSLKIGILPGDDIADYNPAQDADLYEYFLADERYWKET